MSPATLTQPVPSPRTADAAPESTGRPVARSRYIAGPRFDWVFFLGSPLAALAIGIAVSRTGFVTEPIVVHGQVYSGATFLMGVFVHAHLVAVLFRSHGNKAIVRLHPYRFFLVPPLLYAALLSSTWVLVCVSVLATFWDVYHSGLQTFGFARIYDAKEGNDPRAGRRLDWWLNHFLYAGPILAGATMMDHFKDFMDFRAVGADFFTSIPGFMVKNQNVFATAVLATGTLFLLYYVYANWKLHRRGHRISFLKVFLLASTGLCSIYTWGFNSFGVAFFVMNFFHAWQYLGLVWWSERRHMMKAFSVDRLRWKGPLAAILFVCATFSYGYLVQAIDAGTTWLWSVTLVVSIMHFWYDGFIWSVRKQQI